MSGTDRYTSRCPVCDSLLVLDEDRGYLCPHCGWDESVDLTDQDTWIIPDDRGVDLS
jgi:anaerobic ribonucleoside-triphosphate reductase